MAAAAPPYYPPPPQSDGHTYSPSPQTTCYPPPPSSQASSPPPPPPPPPPPSSNYDPPPSAQPAYYPPPSDSQASPPSSSTYDPLPSVQPGYYPPPPSDDRHSFVPSPETGPVGPSRISVSPIQNFSLPPPQTQRSYANQVKPQPALPRSDSATYEHKSAPRQNGMQDSAYSLDPSSTHADNEPSGPIDEVGTFNGGAYRISHRDTNTILTINLAPRCALTAKPGAMVAMSKGVKITGHVSFSMKKFIFGGHLTHSTYTGDGTGPGEVVLAPAALGDIVVIRLKEEDQWRVGSDAFLACTEKIERDQKAQKASKAFFSGEGWFPYTISGHGLLWISSFGAIVKKELESGEEYYVDNGHLVAWCANYEMRTVSSGTLKSHFATKEGWACRFIGPGTVYFQTRNPLALSRSLAM